MALHIRGPWQDLSGRDDLPGHMGVFELADAGGRILYVGYAGGRSRFGLRSEVAAAAADVPAACRCRIEVTTAYLTRWQELLMLHRAVHGSLPPGNPALPGLGRLHPA